MRRWLLLLLICTAAACREPADPAPATTTTTFLPEAPPLATTAEPTTTTTPSFEIPAVIDLPYVQRVLSAIYRLDGEAARHIYARKVPDAELNERLEAIFAGQPLTETKRVLSENAAEGFIRFANPPGDPTVRAVDIAQATAGCLVVRADLDFDPYYNLGSRVNRAFGWCSVVKVQVRGLPVV